MLRRTPLKRTAMKRRPARNRPNAAEKRYHAVVRQLACVLVSADCRGVTTVSHRPGAGMGLKSGHLQVAALCEGHHLRGPCSLEQMGSKAWQRRYGPHTALEEQTLAQVRLLFPEVLAALDLPT